MVATRHRAGRARHYVRRPRGALYAGVRQAPVTLPPSCSATQSAMMSTTSGPLSAPQCSAPPSASRQTTSLRPGLKNSRVTLSVGIPEGIMLDSYPGPYGQVLTNLFLNPMTHAFGEDRVGNIRISGRHRSAQSMM